MFCPECGKELREDINFCPACGHPVSSGDGEKEETGQTPQPEESGLHKKKKKNKIRLFVLAGAVLAGAAAVCGTLVIKDMYVKQRCAVLIKEGNAYEEESDYENAEDSYLKALKTAPEEKEPYLALTDLYLDEGEVEKARTVIRQAQENVQASDRQEFIDMDKEYQDLETYSTVSETGIEADDIYYLRYDNYMNVPENELDRQIFSSCAVIQKDGLYGIVNDSGKIIVEAEYSEAGTVAGYYSLHSETPVYSEEYRINVNDFYLDDTTGQLKPAVAVWAPNINGYKGYYYYCEGELHNVRESFGQMAKSSTQTGSPGTMGVKQAASLLDASSAKHMAGWADEIPGSYAVYGDGGLVTDFIYEECGSESCGLLAVKKDGKWGYVNARGEIVIPMEYDASWPQYTAQGSDGEKPYCYAASEDYVPLLKNGEWEMRNTDGALVIAPGVFEEIRPVYNGKCWVKKDGKWNVIKLENAGNDEAQSDAEQDTETADDTGTDQEIPVYAEGPVEVKGVLEVVEWEHPNGSVLSAYVIRLDTPADLKININGVQTEIENCEIIQIFNTEKGIDNSLIGKHVKVTGELTQSPLTAYYLDYYMIRDAVVLEG